jgi:hypothetical protein
MSYLGRVQYNVMDHICYLARHSENQQFETLRICVTVLENNLNERKKPVLRGL